MKQGPASQAAGDTETVTEPEAGAGGPTGPPFASRAQGQGRAMARSQGGLHMELGGGYASAGQGYNA